MTAPRAERNLNPTRGSGTGRVTPALERMYPAARVAAAGVDSCPWSPASYGWAALDKYKYPYVPTKYIKTKGKSKQRWTISRSHETTMQLQMSVSGTKYAGGLQGSMKQESTLTMKPKVGNKQQRIVKLKWRYQRFRRYCMPASGTFIAYLNTWKWVPKNPTGGNVKPRTKQTFSCGGNGPKYNDLFGSETSIARSSEQTYRNFFSIGGVELDSFQKDKDEQVFTVIPNKRRPAKLCGNNGAPLYANLVKERSY